MSTIKSPAVAGHFYPGTAKALNEMMATFKANQQQDYPCQTRAIIVPHAGYVYSGQWAYDGFQYLNPNATTVVIIAPSHHVLVDGLAVSSFHAFSTPLGDVPVNQTLTHHLVTHGHAHIQDEAFEKEHAVEVQLPFIQTFLPHAQVVPVLTGRTDSNLIQDLFTQHWQSGEVVFVISSDLSHFHQDALAQKIDHITADMIESGDLTSFQSEQACGASGVVGLASFARDNDFSMIRVNLQNSSVTSGDRDRVVGYGTWLLAETTKEQWLKTHFSKGLLKTVKDSIQYALKQGQPQPVVTSDFPAVLQQKGACFVTLEKAGALRGCIGSIEAHRSLIEDVVLNAYHAAFSDQRFSPLQNDEFEQLTISLSLLSAPSPIEFQDERGLLNALQPGVDGVIIQDKGRQAVYLPAVWTQLPDKAAFLKALKQKAGLPGDHFSDTFKAYRFRAVSITSTMS